MILTTVLAMASGIAFIWAIFLYQAAYYQLINTFPLEFQDPLTSRYAFPEFALRPSTPLALQANYVRSLAIGGTAMLCISLSFFSIGQLIGGFLGLGVFLLIATSAVKSWKTYQANCNQPSR